MYIDYKNYLDFEKQVNKFKGQYLSPGGVAKKYEVSRGAVYNWVVRNVIDAHRYSGLQGSFVVISIDELGKIEEFRSKD